jgi:coenzyme F420-reducing hydrogenase alpha subunit
MNASLQGVEGRIKIQLEIDASGSGQPISAVQIHSSRNLAAGRFLQGRSVAEVQHLLPLIFSLCSTAHGCACIEAFEQAQQKSVSESLHQARHALVDMEIAREHLLHILLHWSTFLGVVLPNGMAGYFTDLSSQSVPLFNCADQITNEQRFARFLNTDWEQQLSSLEARLGIDVLGISVEEWLSIRHYADLMSWLENHRSLASRMLRQIIGADWSSQCQSGIAALGELDESRLHQMLVSDQAEEFLARPEWQGQCRESTSLNRCEQTPLLRDLKQVFGNGLLPRVVSRLTELVSLPGRIRGRIEQARASRKSQHNPSSVQQRGQGLAWVEAARGRLLHRMIVEKGVLMSYQILSPTEWNFHPQGVVAAGLLQLPNAAEEELKQLASLYVGCIDPCVGYDLQIHRTVKQRA